MQGLATHTHTHPHPQTPALHLIDNRFAWELGLDLASILFPGWLAGAHGSYGSTLHRCPAGCWALGPGPWLAGCLSAEPLSCRRSAGRVGAGECGHLSELDEAGGGGLPACRRLGFFFVFPRRSLSKSLPASYSSTLNSANGKRTDPESEDDGPSSFLLFFPSSSFLPFILLVVGA